MSDINSSSTSEDWSRDSIVTSGGAPGAVGMAEVLIGGGVAAGGLGVQAGLVWTGLRLKWQVFEEGQMMNHWLWQVVGLVAVHRLSGGWQCTASSVLESS